MHNDRESPPFERAQLLKKFLNQSTQRVLVTALQFLIPPQNVKERMKERGILLLRNVRGRNVPTQSHSLFSLRARSIDRSIKYNAKRYQNILLIYYFIDLLISSFIKTDDRGGGSLAGAGWGGSSRGNREDLDYSNSSFGRRDDDRRRDDGGRRGGWDTGRSSRFRGI